MTIKRKDSAAEELSTSLDTQRLLREGWVTYRRAQTWDPPTDVYENEEGLVIRIEIAGMSEQDLQITLDDRIVIVKGMRNDPEPKQAYHQMEIRYGEFHSEVHLPWAVEPEQVDAAYEDGFLWIFLPRPLRRQVRVVP